MATEYINEGKTVAVKDLYSDIDITFTRHPISNDITKKTDADAVKRSVRNIVMTNHYERPFKPNFGGNIRGMLFELNTQLKTRIAANRLRDLIEKLEPRVDNVQVRFITEDNDLRVNIFYNIINGVKNEELNYIVSRAR